jgi:hypothetical protein
MATKREPAAARQALESSERKRRVSSSPSLAPLAMPQLIHHQHQTTRSSPGHAHVLQLALCFGIVVAVAKKDSRHRVTPGFRKIHISGHQQPWPALENQVLDPKSLARQYLRHTNLQIFGWHGKVTQRGPQGSDEFVFIRLPLIPPRRIERTLVGVVLHSHLVSRVIVKGQRSKT